MLSWLGEARARNTGAWSVVRNNTSDALTTLASGA